jgi:hypothetical protein
VVPGVELHAHRVLEPAWAVFTEKGATIAYTREIHAAGEPLDQAACIAAPGFAFGDEGLIVHEVHEHDRAYTVKSARPKFQVYDDDGVLVAELEAPGETARARCTRSPTRSPSSPTGMARRARSRTPRTS